MRCIAFFFSFLILNGSSYGMASDTSHIPLSQNISVSSGALNKLNDQYSSLDKTIQQRTERLLANLQKREGRLKDKISAKDSTKAAEVFAGSEAKYQELEAKLRQPINRSVSNPLKEYLPGVDSMQTALSFIQQKEVNLPTDKLQQIQAVSGQLIQLQGRLQQADEVQTFVREREQQLKDQLGQYGAGKQLLGINQQAFYYQQELAQYKATLNDPQKLQQAILGVVRQLPAFQSFWERNSYLAQLFPMPGGYGTAMALNGLQTNAQVLAMAGQQLGASSSSASDPTQFLQQQSADAQKSLNDLKEKVANLGGTNGTGDMVMPDFVPNGQKTKSLWRRIELGFNIQNAQGNNLLPATSDLALTAGYKVSDQLTAGLGSCYKLGLGNGWNHIRFSNAGIGLRSFIDIKAKGDIWFTAGWEYNYFQDFSKLSDLPNVSMWQKSALIGLTKKYKVGRRDGSIQLLYDLLAGQQVPRAQAIKFRVGFGF